MHKKLVFLLFTAVLAVLLSVAVVNADDIEHNGYIVKINTSDFRLFDCSDELSEAEYHGDGYYVVDDYETALKLSGVAEYIEPNYVIELHGSYDYSTVMSKNYAINTTGVDSFWNLGCYGEDVLVGVIDSGCINHNLLNGAIVTGFNLLAETEEAEHDVTDTYGHGTMVTGFICARPGNKYAIGMAHHAKVMPLRVFDGQSSSDVMAMKDAIELAVLGGCKVINMSFGTTSDTITMRRAINYAEDNGVVVVASTGNKKTSDEEPVVQYPAGYDTVIGVGAIDSTGTIADFSYNNESVYVTAPGVDVYSTYFSSAAAIGKGSGTSYSTPIVAGIIADMLSINPDLTPAQVRTILKETATSAGTNAEGEDRNDYYGYGIVNGDAITEYLLEGKEYFVSPVDSFTAKPEVTVWKADSTSEYVGIWSEDGNITDIVDSTTDSISVFQNPSATYGTLNFMLWDNLSNIQPLYKVRTITAE